MSHVILLGPTRTATTSIFRYLLKSPQVTCSTKKETDFFLNALWGEKGHRYENYLQEFPKGGSLFLEASPLYFCGGFQVAEAIRRCLPEVKFVVHLRDPVERFISVHNHIPLKRNFDFDLSLEDFFERCLKHGATNSYKDMDWRSLEEGNYGCLLQEWMSIFPPEDFLLVDYALLGLPNSNVLADICQFVGIDPVATADLAAFNQTRFVRNKWLHEQAMQLNQRLEPILNRMPSGVREAVRRLYYGLNQEQTEAEASEQTLERIRDYYRDDADRLKSLLQNRQVTFPRWLEES